MREKILWAAVAAGTVFVIEEIRAYRFLTEAKRRFDDQSIRLANLTERIETLEP